MSQETTYKGKLGDWEQLIQMVADHSAELAHLEGSRQKLEELLKQGQAYMARQAALRAEKQESSLQIKGVMSSGTRLATVIRRSLQQHYGVRAEKLAAFGMNPFRGRKAKDKPAPEEPKTPAAKSGGSAQMEPAETVR